MGQNTQILLRERKSRYVDEFSYHALRVPFVREVLPEAKIIMMVRDPADTIPEMMYFWKYRDPISEAWKRHRATLSVRTLPSLAKKFLVNYLAVRIRGQRESWGPTTPEMSDNRERSLAETVAIQWDSLVRIGLDDLSAKMESRFMIVDFESMLYRPESVIPKIARFCEVDDYSGGLQYAIDLLDPTYRFEKRDKVDLATSRLLDEIVKETRERLGYEYREDWS